MAYQSTPISVRFWAKLARGGPDECWIWRAHRTVKGYGTMWIGRPGRRWEYAHRVAWEIHHGNAPILPVLHHCDNPPCCNPAHLFLGTHKANAVDRTNKGRGARGEGHGMSKLTVDQVRAIRADPRTQEEVAAAYGVSQFTISCVRRRKTWRHVK